MASLNDYISSLTKPKAKPSYASLFSTPATYKSLLPSFQAPSLNLFGTTKPASAPAPIQSSAPAATPATSPTVVKPPVTPPTQQSSAAKTNYINTVVAPPTPAYTPPGATPTPPKEDTSYLDSYRDYLSQYAESLKPSDEINAARTKLGQVQQKIDERSLAARREEEAKLDEMGGTRSGAITAANQIGRRSASELADLGIAESGAARGLSALTGAKEAETSAYKTAMELNKPLQIGDSYYDPKTGKLIPSSKAKEGFSLSEGQARYELNPATGQYEKIASVGKTYAPGTGGGTYGGGKYVEGENPTVDAWAKRIQEGSAKITDIPAAQSGLRSAVTVALNEMGNSPEGRPTTTELGKQALATANDLLIKFDEKKGTSAVGASRGLGGLFTGLLAANTPGSDAFNFKNDFNSLKSQLSLEAVKYLKGQGAVSDAERALLSQAVTKLNLSQSESEFKKTLQTIIDRLATGEIAGTEGGGGGEVLTSPDGTQEVDVNELTPEELAEARAAGWQ